MKNLLCAFLPALALFAAGCAGSRAAAPPSSAHERGAAMEVAPALGVFTSDAAGFDTRSYWLDTGREVVVFDAQFTPELAKKVITDVASKTKSPIRFVVVTHPNPDKFNGASAFQAIGAKVVASESTAARIPGVHAYKKSYFVTMAKMFTDETYPPLATVDVTFKGDFDLPLEGKTKVSLHELAHRGVSSTQTVAYVPALRALVVGDLVHYKAHAWLEGGLEGGKPKPDLASWKLALGELSGYEGATVYGGRGEPAPVAEAVKAQARYLDAMEQLVHRYVEGLGPKRSELAGPKAPTHHKRIAELAKEAFPDYALPYMVEYGVYALAAE
jgi:glyoxylase-like metal-dependent hydrolase (beta-lactamase superfamily II)